MCQCDTIKEEGLILALLLPHQRIHNISEMMKNEIKLVKKQLILGNREMVFLHGEQGMEQ